MSEYTPTTEEVETHWADVGFASDRASFRRWLVEVERAAAEKAWTEGVATALNYAKREPDGITLKLVTIDGAAWENPYRRNEGEKDE